MMDPDAIGTLLGLGLFAILFGIAVAVVLVILPFWKIFSKAGFSGALSLLLFFPLVNIIMLFVLAFSEWPVERELRDLKSRMGGQWPQQPNPYGPQPPNQYGGQYPPQR